MASAHHAVFPTESTQAFGFKRSCPFKQTRMVICQTQSCGVVQVTIALLFPASYKHLRIMFPTSRYSLFYCIVVLLTSLNQGESWVSSNFGNTAPLPHGGESLLLQSFDEQESESAMKANVVDAHSGAKNSPVRTH